MMRLVMAAAAILAFSAASADPLAEGFAGKQQCYRPNVEKKTCAALSGYSLRHDGAIVNTADVLLSPNPQVVMRTISTVQFKDEAVCGPMRKEDIQVATILVNGAPLPEDKAVSARAQIIGAMKSMLGREVCTTYVPDGDKLSAKVTVDGAAKPEYTQTVIWVAPEDGYRVAP
jgi:hypothetical protein